MTVPIQVVVERTVHVPPRPRTQVDAPGTPAWLSPAPAPCLSRCPGGGTARTTRQGPPPRCSPVRQRTALVLQLSLGARERYAARVCALPEGRGSWVALDEPEPAHKQAVLGALGSAHSTNSACTLACSCRRTTLSRAWAHGWARTTHNTMPYAHHHQQVRHGHQLAGALHTQLLAQQHTDGANLRGRGRGRGRTWAGQGNAGERRPSGPF